MISIKSRREVDLMRKTCQLASQTLDYIQGELKPGMSTEDVNTLCHEYIVKNGAYPSPLNYRGFPKSICTSLNNVICHGIPSTKDVLKDGDLLNIDITTYLNKFHGDTNRTFYIGEVSDKAKKLVEVTYEAMIAGIKTVGPGSRLGDIGAAIQEVAEGAGYSVVRDFCGHGIGREFHEEPQVLHYGKRGTGIEFKPGMTFTIEPMINEGHPSCEILADDWTAVTRDGSLSAQFEHTILVTDDGHEILTIGPHEDQNLRYGKLSVSESIFYPDYAIKVCSNGTSHKLELQVSKAEIVEEVRWDGVKIEIKDNVPLGQLGKLLKYDVEGEELLPVLSWDLLYQNLTQAKKFRAEDLLCFCALVTKSEVRSLLGEGETFQERISDIQEKTQLGMFCGNCMKDVEELLGGEESLLNKLSQSKGSFSRMNALSELFMFWGVAEEVEIEGMQSDTLKLKCDSIEVREKITSSLSSFPFSVLFLAD